MSSKGVLENKISSIRKYLKIAERYRGYSIEELLINDERRGAVERYLYLLAQATIDLAEASISFKSYRKPQAMAEAFDILSENGLVDRVLSERLRKMVGFRNILAHDYEQLDYTIVKAVLDHSTNDITEFIGVIEQKLL